MLTLLGSLLGFIGSTVPTIFRFFEQKRDQEHEYKMVELQQKGLEKAAEQALNVANVNADISEFKELQRSASVQTGTWVDVLTATVRPVITYAFFALFVYVEIKTYSIMSSLDLSPLTKLGMIWDEDTKSLFAAIMSFWFGGRALEKARTRARNV